MKNTKNLWMNFLISLVYMLLWLYGKTWRYRYHSTQSYEDDISSGKKYTHVVWHDQMLPLTFYWRHKNAATLASKSKDGEFITKLLHKMGYNVSRGSSSRGGAGGLIGLKKYMDDFGCSTVITLDGPRGPRHKAKEGAIYLANLTDTMIVPVFFSCSSYKQFASWDKFILPLPFAKIDIFVIPPIPVGGDEPMEQKLENFNTIMNRLTHEYSPNFI